MFVNDVSGYHHKEKDGIEFFQLSHHSTKGFVLTAILFVTIIFLKAGISMVLDYAFPWGERVLHSEIE